MNFNPVSKILNTKLKYHLVEDGYLKKEEIMDFPVRLYENEEFETVLKLNGFNDFICYEVADGYDTGTSFQVFECAI